MCDKAIDDFLPPLKFVPDWSVTSKMIKNSLLLFMQMIIYSILMKILVMLNFLAIVSIDYNNINLDDTNYDEDDPENIVHIRLFAWHIKFEKRKALKKELN